MEKVRYLWRHLTEKQRAGLLQWRKRQHLPWHSPPHTHVPQTRIHLSASCYEHRAWIGTTPERMDRFTSDLLTLLAKITGSIHAWCVLPNHYHVLLETADNMSLIGAMGKFHGRTSHRWNGEENNRGRKVFFRAIDKPVVSCGHFWATMNYIHHNPVHHKYVKCWEEWPWSSAWRFLEATGVEEARRVWREYPVLGMGRNWDASSM